MELKKKEGCCFSLRTFLSHVFFIVHTVVHDIEITISLLYVLFDVLCLALRFFFFFQMISEATLTRHEDMAPSDIRSAEQALENHDAVTEDYKKRYVRR